MQRTLIIVVVAIALVAGVGGVLYAFGTPQAPDLAVVAGTAPAVPAPEAADPAPAGGRGMGDAPAPDPDAVAPPADPNSPLAIQIPGCVCHSDDPKLVKQHAEYRMNQCAGCHVGGTPTGQ